MKTSLSPIKLAANRANAQKSTGPKMPAGRDVSKMNALKHGILSREVVVHGNCINESDQKFAALHQRLWEELIPVGPLEEMLVDQIATAHWRLRRALKAEAGEIALNVDCGSQQRKNLHPAVATLDWGSFGDPMSDMRNSAIGNRFMESQLKSVRTSVEQIGELTEAAIQKVIFRGKAYMLTEDLLALHAKLQANPLELDATALRASQKKQALAYIDSELEHILWSKARHEKREKEEEEARQAAALLPESSVLDKILRYETKLERQLYRAINQLERLQRLRQGEAVPPPLTVEVSEQL